MQQIQKFPGVIRIRSTEAWGQADEVLLGSDVKIVTDGL